VFKLNDARFRWLPHGRTKAASTIEGVKRLQAPEHRVSKGD